MSTDKIAVFVTCSSEEESLKIARQIVQERLAACVNMISPVRSVYRWQGAVEEAQEWLLIIKTRGELFAALEERIRGLHSYSVPEIIAVPIRAGSARYLEWIEQETRE